MRVEILTEIEMCEVVVQKRREDRARDTHLYTKKLMAT
jgi:hypothetical protein